MLLGTLGAGLAGKGVIRAEDEAITKTKRKGIGIVRAGYGSKRSLIKNKDF